MNDSCSRFLVTFLKGSCAILERLSKDFVNDSWAILERFLQAFSWTILEAEFLSHSCRVPERFLNDSWRVRWRRIAERFLEEVSWAIRSRRIRSFVQEDPFIPFIRSFVQGGFVHSVRVQPSFNLIVQKIVSAGRFRAKTTNLRSLCSKTPRRDFSWTIRARIYQFWPTPSGQKLMDPCPYFLLFSWSQGKDLSVLAHSACAKIDGSLPWLSRRMWQKRHFLALIVQNTRILKRIWEVLLKSFLEYAYSGQSGQGNALFITFFWTTRARILHFLPTPSVPKLMDPCPDFVLFSRIQGKDPSILAHSEWVKIDESLPWLSRKKSLRGVFEQRLRKFVVFARKRPAETIFWTIRLKLG